MAGGHGIVYDGPNDKDLIAFVEKIWSEGGVVGSVCHGPAALVNVHAPNGEPIVKGRKVSLLCSILYLLHVLLDLLLVNNVLGKSGFCSVLLGVCMPPF
jgi:hypothetical protein